MKSTALLFLLTLQFLTSFSQSTSDSLATYEHYYVVMKGDNEEKYQTLVKSDKIYMKLINKKKVRDRIAAVNPDFILLESKGRIETSDIKWIRKSKPTTLNLVSGILFTAVGTTLIVGSQGSVGSFDAVGQLILIGTGLTITGISILAPPKYRLDKGDKLYYRTKAKKKA